MTEQAIKKLYTAIIDTREGYMVAERGSEEPGVKRLLREMIELRGRDHVEIRDALSAVGENIDDEPSLMKTMHKAAAGLKSAVTGLDDGKIEQFITVEDSIVRLYNAAIAEQNGPLADMLCRQKAELVGKVFAMRSMA